MTTRRSVGLSVLHFSVVRVRNNPSRFVTCMRACVQRHRWARRTSGGDPTVGGSGVKGDARSVKPLPSPPPTVPTTNPHPNTPTTPSHITWTRHAAADVVNVPHSFAKGPLLVVSASACVRACVYARCTRRRTVTGMTRLLLLLLQLLLFNIFIVHYIQYNDDAGVRAYTPRSPRYHLETIVNYTECIN